VRYPLERIYEEVAFIAYHFHWAYEDILNMEHRERQRWCEEISKINRKINGESEGKIKLF
jgi:transcriptional antiterminator